MSRGTPHRTMRIDDDVWLPAKAKAEAENVHLSDVTRDALRAYLAGHTLEKAWDEGAEAAYEFGDDFTTAQNPYRKR